MPYDVATVRAIELFAGVGGFRLGLRDSGINVVWSNQWEPSSKKQWASSCYVKHFGAENHSNKNINRVPLDHIPAHDLLVGGFPCQDYSVATTKAKGLRGSKGALWWRIYDILAEKEPSYVLLENVDRLLKSPRFKRGRHFGVVLWCLAHLGYSVEWRVINAADYGGAQRRRRVFIFAAKQDTKWNRVHRTAKVPADLTVSGGFFATAFPAVLKPDPKASRGHNAILPSTQKETRQRFQAAFGNAGILIGRKIWSRAVLAKDPSFTPLEKKMVRDVDPKYFLRKEDLEKWTYLKGRKAAERRAANGHIYAYEEGKIPFPDDRTRASRTILTTEGGPTPTRFKHVVKDLDNEELRRLTPEEVEALNGFEKDWTREMPEGWRYFCMGNALVVDLVKRMARVLVGLPPVPTVEGSALKVEPAPLPAVGPLVVEVR